MILGTGVDIVEIQRMEGLLSRKEEATRLRLFTAREWSDCADKKLRVQRLAARFAAKEALLKALGTGLRRGIFFRDMETVSGLDGRPLLQLTGRAAEIAEELGVHRIHLSFSHGVDHAIAFVVLEGATGSVPSRDAQE